MRGAKSANSKLFKDFCNEAEMEKNSQIAVFILSSSLRSFFHIEISKYLIWQAV